MNSLQKAQILKGAKTPTAHTNFSNSTSEKLAKLAPSPWQEVFILGFDRVSERGVFFLEAQTPVLILPL